MTEPATTKVGIGYSQRSILHRVEDETPDTLGGELVWWTRCYHICVAVPGGSIDNIRRCIRCFDGSEGILEPIEQPDPATTTSPRLRTHAGPPRRGQSE